MVEAKCMIEITFLCNEFIILLNDIFCILMNNTIVIHKGSFSTGMDNSTAENKGVRPGQRQAASGAMVKQRKILLDDRGSDGEGEKDSESEQDYVTSKWLVKKLDQANVSMKCK